MHIPNRLLPYAASALLLVGVTACNQDDPVNGVKAEDTDDMEGMDEDMDEEMDEEMDETEG